MTKDDIEFEAWFEILRDDLAGRGVTFSDTDAVRGDYESGRNVWDVVDEIANEYLLESE